MSALIVIVMENQTGVSILCIYSANKQRIRGVFLFRQLHCLAIMDAKVWASLPATSYICRATCRWSTNLKESLACRTLIPSEYQRTDLWQQHNEMSLLTTCIGDPWCTVFIIRNAPLEPVIHKGVVHSFHCPANSLLYCPILPTCSWPFGGCLNPDIY